MQKALLDELSTPIRRKHLATFVTTETDVIDAGPGRSFVGLHIPVGFNAALVTFKGASSDEAAGETAPTVVTVNIENGTGAPKAAYTIAPGTTVGYHPLSPTILNGLRWLQVVSNVSQATKIPILVSKPV